LLGVLDLDSPLAGRFGEQEERLLTKIAEIYVRSVDWPSAG
jgi:putative methionine-R-sulfoxide reductase with GAF domain